jgi:hypothetical protein
VIWPAPPGRWFAHTCLGAVPTVCHFDRQHCVSTTPAATLMLRTGLSSRDACRCRPVCHPITLSVRGRSHLSSSQDNRRTLPTPLCSHRAPFLPCCCTPLLQVSKRRPPRTALVRHCATPSWPLSHYPPQAIIEAPSQPPPSIAEATLPSSTTSGHRRAPPSPQRPLPELTTTPRTPSRRSPPLLWPAVPGSPLLTCVTAVSPPR